MIDLIGRFLPGLAARWYVGRMNLEASQRLYEAAQSSTLRPRRGTNASGDALMTRAGTRLRDASRYFDENYDFAVSLFNDLVDSTVGEGVAIEPAVRRLDGTPDTELNKQIRDAWARYWEFPEVTGATPGNELERLVARSLYRDGEVFGVHHTSRAAPFPTRVPYVIEILEADFCPFDLLTTEDNITHGIVRDEWGRPVRYLFHKRHPGNDRRAGSIANLKQIPATRVIHPKITKRLGQARGVPILHPVMNRLDDIKDGEESERVAMRVNASICAAIIKTDLAATGGVNAKGDRSFKMQPGMVFDKLLPGEGIEMIDGKRPNTKIIEFLQWNLRAACAGIGARYSAVARDYNGTYSSQRQELVEQRRATRRLLNYLVAMFYRPVRSQFITAAVLNGDIQLSPDTDLRTLVHAEYRGPAIPWIDPQKEMMGFKIALELGVISRPMVIRDMGNDPELVTQQIEDDDFQPRGDSDAFLIAGDGDDDDDNDERGALEETSEAA